MTGIPNPSPTANLKRPHNAPLSPPQHPDIDSVPLKNEAKRHRLAPHATTSLPAPASSLEYSASVASSYHPPTGNPSSPSDIPTPLPSSEKDESADRIRFICHTLRCPETSPCFWLGNPYHRKFNRAPLPPFPKSPVLSNNSRPLHPLVLHTYSQLCQGDTYPSIVADGS